MFDFFSPLEVFMKVAAFVFSLSVRLLFFLTVSLILSEAVWAQSGTSSGPTGPGRASGAGSVHTIRGKIFLPSGAVPEQRIRVVLEMATGGIISEAFSDSVGTFEFRSIPGSTYRITVPSDGSEYESTQEMVEVSGSIPRTVSVQIYLRDKNSGVGTKTKGKLLSVAEHSQKIPKDALKAYEKSDKLAKEGKTEQAIAQLQESLKIFPDYLQALNRLGEQYANQQKPDEAREMFEKAIRINDKFPQAHINLGLLSFNLKQYAAAAKHLEAANRLDDSFPLAHLYFGLALMESTPPDYEQAEREMLKAFSLGQGEMPQVRKYLFNLYVRQRKMPQAAEQLEAYLREAPKSPDAEDVRQILEKVRKSLPMKQ
jgi:Tfp pilus assembly protein PilF